MTTLPPQRAALAVYLRLVSCWLRAGLLGAMVRLTVPHRPPLPPLDRSPMTSSKRGGLPLTRGQVGDEGLESGGQIGGGLQYPAQSPRMIPRSSPSICRLQAPPGAHGLKQVPAFITYIAKGRQSSGESHRMFNAGESGPALPARPDSGSDSEALSAGRLCFAFLLPFDPSSKSASGWDCSRRQR